MRDAEGIVPKDPLRHERSENPLIESCDEHELEIIVGTGCQLWLRIIAGVE